MSDIQLTAGHKTDPPGTSFAACGCIFKLVIDDYGHATNKSSWQQCLKHAAAPALLEALDACETTLAISDRSCGDLPPSGERCEECIGCSKERSFQLARAAIAAAKEGGSVDG